MILQYRDIGWQWVESIGDPPLPLPSVVGLTVVFLERDGSRFCLPNPPRPIYIICIYSLLRIYVKFKWVKWCWGH